MVRGSSLTDDVVEADIIPFEIEISEDYKNYVSLTCDVCMWDHLSFSLNGTEARAFDVSGTATSGTPSDINSEKYPDFLISVVRNGNHFVLRSERGTNWDKVEFMMSCNNRNLLSHKGITIEKDR